MVENWSFVGYYGYLMVDRWGKGQPEKASHRPSELGAVLL